MSLPRILVVQAGSTHPEVERAFGDYPRWFAAVLEQGEARCEAVAPFRGEALPAPGDHPGVIVTGSPASVRDEAPWMEEVARFCLDAAEAGSAVLGVCFGHQLLGEALGGRVAPNPRGRELGTVRVRLTEAGKRDPLFAGLPDEILVQQTHGDELAEDPSALRLAENDFSRWQAFAHGERIRGVQFHPETTPACMRAILDATGHDAPVWESDHGRRILHNWDRFFVRAERK